MTLDDYRVCLVKKLFHNNNKTFVGSDASYGPLDFTFQDVWL